MSASDGHSAELPLTGVKVLDLSRVLAGPSATQLLADYGADVIKIERPGRGDDTRAWGPPFVEGGDAAYFQAANRNKRSVTIDFTVSAGADLVRQLTKQCAIVVENFKTGGLGKYGLDYPTLRDVNPAIVYCSITGFGHTGPLAHRAGYDYLIQAMGGLMSVTGQPDGVPGAEPMKVGVAVADLFTGLYAVTGILAALRQAEATGQGRHLDVALFDCQLAMLANQASNYLASGVSPTRLGNSHPNIAPYQVFTVADGHIVVAVGNDGQFARLCQELGVPALAQDERFVTNADRVRNRAALMTQLADVLRTRSGADWIATFEAVDVPCGPINDVAAALTSEQARARGAVLTHGDGRQTVASPVRFGERTDTAPPALGAHTEEILREELGVSGEDLVRLKQAGAC